MSNETKQALAARAVACKGWRWMPGMSTQFGIIVERDALGLGEADWVGGGKLEADDINDDALPDLDDPATLGCLLALVRAAWDGCEIELTVIPVSDAGVAAPCILAIRDVGHGDPLWSMWAARSVAEALVSALEAAVRWAKVDGVWLLAEPALEAAASLAAKPKLETATRSVTDFQRAVLGSITNSGATFSQPMVLLGAVHTAGMRLHELGLVGANAAGFYPLTDTPTPDAPLRVHMLDLAAKWSALAGDGLGKREGAYLACAMELRRVVNHASAAPVGGERDTAAASLTDWSTKTVGEIAGLYQEAAPKPITTEARAVLVAWLPGYDDPIAWWATDDRAAFTVALVSCAIDQRRAQTDPADEQPTDHEISREFRAAVRIEAVKP